MDIKNVGIRNSSINDNSGRVSNSSNTPGNVPVTRVASAALLANLSKGSVFSGDIIDIRNSAIKILLDGNQTIQAKAMNGSDLNIGDYIKFMVKENNGSQILIKALSIDNRQSNPLVLALESANIPVNERNMQMVSEMMRNEMSIDKYSINEMYKNISAFESESPASIVNIVRHDILLTGENIKQFDNYMNYEHRIMYELHDIASDIPEFIKANLDSNESGMRGFVAELLTELPDTIVSDTNDTSIINMVADEDIFINNIDDTEIVDVGLNDNSIEEKNSQSGVVNDDMPLENQVTQSGIDDMKYLDTKSALNLIATLPKDELSQFISSNKFEKLVKEAMSKDFSLNVNEFTDNGNEIKESVIRLYEKLEKNIEKFMDLLKNTGSNTDNLSDKLNNLKNNLSFMNEINQMTSYVQLPLKFSETKNHGDLYVYNKNRGKIVDKDVITAFMHLDMEYLGATDINIRLEKNSLNTTFSIADDLSVQIIDEHLYELKERLEKAGFIVSLSVTRENKEITPFEEMLETDKPKISIKRYSFDVRA